MTRSQSFLLRLWSVCLLSLLGIAVADSKTSAEDRLIQDAESKLDIFSLPSFEMKAAVRVDNQGRMLDGSYTLLWNGPQQWREEISFPGYSEVQVGAKTLVFIKRTTDLEPLQIEQLHSTLGFGSSPSPGSFFHLDVRADEVVKKSQERKINGTQVRCLEIVNQEKHERRVCADSSNGVMVREGRFQDKGMVVIGSKVFPQYLSLKDDGKFSAEVQITELKLLGRFPAEDFEPPSGANSRVGCMNPLPGHRVSNVAPQYPEQDRSSRTQGTVDVYAVIASNGVPQHLAIAHGVSPTLNQASIDAVQQWRYQPATCDGIPVEAETVITVNYSLSY